MAISFCRGDPCITVGTRRRGISAAGRKDEQFLSGVKVIEVIDPVIGKDRTC